MLVDYAGHDRAGVETVKGLNLSRAAPPSTTSPPHSTQAWAETPPLARLTPMTSRAARPWRARRITRATACSRQVDPERSPTRATAAASRRSAAERSGPLRPLAQRIVRPNCMRTSMRAIVSAHPAMIRATPLARRVMRSEALPPHASEIFRRDAASLCQLADGAVLDERRRNISAARPGRNRRPIGWPLIAIPATFGHRALPWDRFTRDCASQSSRPATSHRPSALEMYAASARL
jgi:hypothetical protein